MDRFKKFSTENIKVNLHQDLQEAMDVMEKTLANENIHILSWNFDELMQELNPRFQLF